MEALQIAKYVKNYGAEPGLLFGRSKLCPVKAQNSAQCLLLRERGTCKVRIKRIAEPIFDVDELYRLGVCPYEQLHARGRQSDVVIMPMAYINKLSHLATILSLFEGIELVAIDEVHNLMELVEVEDPEMYARKYCEGRHCLVLPLAAEITRGRKFVAASASVLPSFAEIFTRFLDAQYIYIDELPGVENLELEVEPLPVRYRNRLKKPIMSVIEEYIRKKHETRRRVIAFFPNKQLAGIYLRLLSDLPVSETPLGDVDHVIVTYYGSPVSEGINIDVNSGILVGFPWPQVKSRELWIKAKILRRIGYSGFHYAVLFPAVSAVIQAVGRVLRNLENRKKNILLIDDRFVTYRKYLPAYLQVG